MRKSTSKAFRATATVAGVAALGASFAGTAAADESSDLYGDNFSSDSDEFSGEGLDSDSMSPALDQDGLMSFDLPTLQTSSLRTSDPISDLLGHEDEEWDDEDEWDDEEWDDEDEWDDDDSDDCGSHEDDSEYDDHGIQHPVQCEGNDFHEGEFEIAGHEFGDFSEPSSMRTSDDDTPFSLAEEDEGTESSQSSDEADLGSITEGDGLSGHEVTLPIG